MLRRLWTPGGSESQPSSPNSANAPANFSDSMISRSSRMSTTEASQMETSHNRSSASTTDNSVHTTATRDHLEPVTSPDHPAALSLNVSGLSSLGTQDAPSTAEALPTLEHGYDYEYMIQSHSMDSAVPAKHTASVSKASLAPVERREEFDSSSTSLSRPSSLAAQAAVDAAVSRYGPDQSDTSSNPSRVSELGIGENDAEAPPPLLPGYPLSHSLTASDRRHSIPTTPTAHAPLEDPYAQVASSLSNLHPTPPGAANVHTEEAILHSKWFHAISNSQLIAVTALLSTYPPLMGARSPVPHPYHPDLLPVAAQFLGEDTSGMDALQIALMRYHAAQQEFAANSKKGSEDLETCAAVIHALLDTIWKKELDEHRFGRAQNTSLHLAAFLGQAAVVDRLLAKGATASVQNGLHYYPFDVTDCRKIRAQLIQAMEDEKHNRRPRHGFQPDLLSEKEGVALLVEEAINNPAPIGPHRADRGSERLLAVSQSDEEFDAEDDAHSQSSTPDVFAAYDRLMGIDSDVETEPLTASGSDQSSTARLQYGWSQSPPPTEVAPSEYEVQRATLVVSPARFSTPEPELPAPPHSPQSLGSNHSNDEGFHARSRPVPVSANGALAGSAMSSDSFHTAHSASLPNRSDSSLPSGDGASNLHTNGSTFDSSLSYLEMGIRPAVPSVTARSATPPLPAHANDAAPEPLHPRAAPTDPFYGAHASPPLSALSVGQPSLSPRANAQTTDPQGRSETTVTFQLDTPQRPRSTGSTTVSGSSQSSTELSHLSDEPPLPRLLSTVRFAAEPEYIPATENASTMTYSDEQSCMSQDTDDFITNELYNMSDEIVRSEEDGEAPLLLRQGLYPRSMSVSGITPGGLGSSTGLASMALRESWSSPHFSELHADNEDRGTNHGGMLLEDIGWYTKDTAVNEALNPNSPTHAPTQSDPSATDSAPFGFTEAAYYNKVLESDAFPKDLGLNSQSNIVWATTLGVSTADPLLADDELALRAHHQELYGHNGPRPKPRSRRYTQSGPGLGTSRLDDDLHSPADPTFLQMQPETLQASNRPQPLHRTNLDAVQLNAGDLSCPRDSDDPSELDHGAVDALMSRLVSSPDLSLRPASSLGLRRPDSRLSQHSLDDAPLMGTPSYDHHSQRVTSRDMGRAWSLSPDIPDRSYSTTSRTQLTATDRPASLRTDSPFVSTSSGHAALVNPSPRRQTIPFGTDQQDAEPDQASLFPDLQASRDFLASRRPESRRGSPLGSPSMRPGSATGHRASHSGSVRPNTKVRADLGNLSPHRSEAVVAQYIDDSIRGRRPRAVTESHEAVGPLRTSSKPFLALPAPIQTQAFRSYSPSSTYSPQRSMASPNTSMVSSIGAPGATTNPTCSSPSLENLERRALVSSFLQNGSSSSSGSRPSSAMASFLSDHANLDARGPSSSMHARDASEHLARSHGSQEALDNFSGSFHVGLRDHDHRFALSAKRLTGERVEPGAGSSLASRRASQDIPAAEVTSPRRRSITRLSKSSLVTQRRMEFEHSSSSRSGDDGFSFASANSVVDLAYSPVVAPQRSSAAHSQRLPPLPLPLSPILKNPLSGQEQSSPSLSPLDNDRSPRSHPIMIPSYTMIQEFDQLVQPTMVQHNLDSDTPFLEVLRLMQEDRRREQLRNHRAIRRRHSISEGRVPALPRRVSTDGRQSTVRAATTAPGANLRGLGRRNSMPSHMPRGQNTARTHPYSRPHRSVVSPPLSATIPTPATWLPLAELRKESRYSSSGTAPKRSSTEPMHTSFQPTEAPLQHSRLGPDPMQQLMQEYPVSSKSGGSSRNSSTVSTPCASTSSAGGMGLALSDGSLTLSSGLPSSFAPEPITPSTMLPLQLDERRRCIPRSRTSSLSALASGPSERYFDGTMPSFAAQSLSAPYPRAPPPSSRDRMTTAQKQDLLCAIRDQIARDHPDRRLPNDLFADDWERPTTGLPKVSQFFDPDNRYTHITDRNQLKVLLIRDMQYLTDRLGRVPLTEFDRPDPLALHPGHRQVAKHLERQRNRTRSSSRETDELDEPTPGLDVHLTHLRPLPISSHTSASEASRAQLPSATSLDSVHGEAWLNQPFHPWALAIAKYPFLYYGAISTSSILTQINILRNLARISRETQQGQPLSRLLEVSLPGIIPHATTANNDYDSDASLNPPAYPLLEDDVRQLIRQRKPQLKQWLMKQSPEVLQQLLPGLRELYVRQIGDVLDDIERMDHFRGRRRTLAQGFALSAVSMPLSSRLASSYGEMSVAVRELPPRPESAPPEFSDTMSQYDYSYPPSSRQSGYTTATRHTMSHPRGLTASRPDTHALRKLMHQDLCNLRREYANLAVREWVNHANAVEAPQGRSAQPTPTTGPPNSRGSLRPVARIADSVSQSLLSLSDRMDSGISTPIPPDAPLDHPARPFDSQTNVAEAVSQILNEIPAPESVIGLTLGTALPFSTVVQPLAVSVLAPNQQPSPPTVPVVSTLPADQSVDNQPAQGVPLTARSMDSSASTASPATSADHDATSLVLSEEAKLNWVNQWQQVLEYFEARKSRAWEKLPDPEQYLDPDYHGPLPDLPRIVDGQIYGMTAEMVAADQGLGTESSSISSRLSSTRSRRPLADDGWATLSSASSRPDMTPKAVDEFGQADNRTPVATNQSDSQLPPMAAKAAPQPTTPTAPTTPSGPVQATTSTPSSGRTVELADTNSLQAVLDQFPAPPPVFTPTPRTRAESDSYCSRLEASAHKRHSLIDFYQQRPGKYQSSDPQLSMDTRPQHQLPLLLDADTQSALTTSAESLASPNQASADYSQWLNSEITAPRISPPPRPPAPFHSHSAINLPRGPLLAQDLLTQLSDAQRELQPSTSDPHNRVLPSIGSDVSFLQTDEDLSNWVGMEDVARAVAAVEADLQSVPVHDSPTSHIGRTTPLPPPSAIALSSTPRSDGLAAAPYPQLSPIHPTPLNLGDQAIPLPTSSQHLPDSMAPALTQLTALPAELAPLPSPSDPNSAGAAEPAQTVRGIPLPAYANPFVQVPTTETCFTPPRPFLDHGHVYLRILSLEDMAFTPANPCRAIYLVIHNENEVRVTKPVPAEHIDNASVRINQEFRIPLGDESTLLFWVRLQTTAKVSPSAGGSAAQSSAFRKLKALSSKNCFPLGKREPARRRPAPSAIPDYPRIPKRDSSLPTPQLPSFTATSQVAPRVATKDRADQPGLAAESNFPYSTFRSDDSSILEDDPVEPHAMGIEPAATGPQYREETHGSVTISIRSILKRVFARTYIGSWPVESVWVDGPAGRLVLQLFYLPALPQMLPREIPFTFREMMDTVAAADWHTTIWCHGYLYMRGLDSPFWRRRYFKLEGAFLIAYHEETKAARMLVDLTMAGYVIDNDSDLIGAAGSTIAVPISRPGHRRKRSCSARSASRRSQQQPYAAIGPSRPAPSERRQSIATIEPSTQPPEPHCSSYLLSQLSTPSSHSSEHHSDSGFDSGTGSNPSLSPQSTDQRHSKLLPLTNNSATIATPAPTDLDTSTASSSDSSTPHTSFAREQEKQAYIRQYSLQSLVHPKNSWSIVFRDDDGRLELYADTPEDKAKWVTSLKALVGKVPRVPTWFVRLLTVDQSPLPTLCSSSAPDRSVTAAQHNPRPAIQQQTFTHPTTVHTHAQTQAHASTLPTQPTHQMSPLSPSGRRTAAAATPRARKSSAVSQISRLRWEETGATKSRGRTSRQSIPDFQSKAAA
ncbi:Bud site selection protein bud4 [Dimargaris verticillata]|uniref:Bud site selection protein bud4 n=1 Tax=Dimargaris verticillata TaxID=2761393 RepID=A0A9W8B419_9FUNG|nr:Bud site selection protein bud4 [Dimargaris verticillata]